MSQKQQRVRRSLVNSLHDRSSNDRLYKSTTSIQQNKIEYATLEYVNNLILRIERLENEAIRYNKMLNIYVNHIEDLELKVNQLENTNRKNLISNVLLKRVTVTPTQLLDLSSSSTTNSKTDGTIAIATAQTDFIQPGKISGWLRFTQLFKHRPSLESLKKKNIYKNEVCFDTELEKVVKHEQYSTIPKIIVECICLIEIKIKNSPTSTEGLYRMSGSYADIQKIRFAIDNNDYDCLKSIKDIHTLVGVLKLFLREIKNPLVKISEIRAFIGSDREWTLSNNTSKIEALKKLVKSLPEQNRDTLCYFFKHLCRLTHMPLQFVNARSLAVSLTPTIFHFTACEKVDLHTTLKESELLTSCLEVFIEYQERIFETMKRSLSKKLSRCISYPCLIGNKT